MPRKERKEGPPAPVPAGAWDPLVESWLTRKLAWGTRPTFGGGTNEQFHICRKPVPGELECRDVEFAWVSLMAQSSEEFAYESRVAWPRDPEVYEAAVLDAILDEIFTRAFGPVMTRVRFTLKEIRWDDATSCPRSFYLATRRAVRGLISFQVRPEGVWSALNFACHHPSRTNHGTYSEMVHVINGLFYGIAQFGPHQGLLGPGFSNWLAAKFTLPADQAWWAILRQAFPDDEEAFKNLARLAHEYSESKESPPRRKAGKRSKPLEDSRRLSPQAGPASPREDAEETMRFDEAAGNPLSRASTGIPAPVLAGWLSRKRRRGACSIPRPARTEVYYYLNTSYVMDHLIPEQEHAWVTLSVRRSAEFAYESQVQWPRDAETYEAAVRDAILDELLTRDPAPVVFKVRFILERMHWSEDVASPRVFYLAARQAARDLLSIMDPMEDVMAALEVIRKHPMTVSDPQDFEQVIHVVLGYLQGIPGLRAGSNFHDPDFGSWLRSKLDMSRFQESGHWAWWSMVRVAFPEDKDAIENLLPLMREFLQTRYPCPRRRPPRRD